MLSCVVCQANLSGRQKKFCSKQCKGKYCNNVSLNGTFQKDRYLIRKATLIKIKGGGCQKCGYNKNYSALCFHHRDPSNKLFKLDARKLSNTKWENILTESDKCDLLCHNCHMEIHFPEMDSENIKPYEDDYNGKLVKCNKTPDPNIEELQVKLLEKSIRNIAKDYGVTDIVIKRWVKEFKLKTPPIGHWNKKD